MEWLGATNAETPKRLTHSELYNEVYVDTLSAINSKDKLLEISIIGDLVYTLKKNAVHPRDLYQRTSLIDFKSSDPKWRTVLDIDEMSKQVNVN
mgnify:CR=1 FL=1